MSEVLNTGVNPAGLAVYKNKLFVANNNNYGLPNCDNVSVFDLEKGTILATVNDKSFNEPYTVNVDKKRKIAYVTNSNSPSKKGEVGTITKIDVKNNTVIGTIGKKVLSGHKGLDGPSSFEIYGDRAYVCNYGAPNGLKSGNGKTVSVIDLNTETIIDTIQVDQAPADCCVSPYGTFLYVICYVDGNKSTGTLLMIRLRNHSIVKRIKNFSGPFNVVSVNDYLLVSNFGSNNFSPYGTTVSVVDPFLGKIIHQLEVGIQPSGLALDPEGKFVVATCYNTLYQDPVNYNGLTAGVGSVVYIDTKNWKVSSPVSAGPSPANVAISQDGKYSYVSNYSGNTVTVLENDLIN